MVVCLTSNDEINHGLMIPVHEKKYTEYRSKCQILLSVDCIAIHLLGNVIVVTRH